MPGPAHRTSTRLADGRELIYFDDGPGKDRGATDTRDLLPGDTTSTTSG
jgi:UDPglucose--hexose-1-phosphate uridylyltransferase